MKVVAWIIIASCKFVISSVVKKIGHICQGYYYAFIDIYLHDLMLFDYMYKLILRTGQSPISSDNQLSTVLINYNSYMHTV